jgi:inosine/xanthosine triphosphate pyrophosphatase family protein
VTTDPRALRRDGRTFAEMSAAEKNARSHRARAVRALVVGLLQG